MRRSARSTVTSTRCSRNGAGCSTLAGDAAMPAGLVVRRPGSPRHRRLLRRPGRRGVPAQLHRRRRVRDRRPAPRAGRRARELRPPGPRAAVLDRAPEHGVLRARRRAALGRCLARRGAARERAPGALEGVLPHRLLPARGHHAGRCGGRVALPLSSTARAAERDPRPRRRSTDRLAGGPALRDARAHPARRVEELRLQHGRLHRRAAEHPRAPLRGGAPRRGERVAAVPARDAPDARPNDGLRRAHHHDRLLPALRRAVRDDAGRAGGEHAQRRPPHVRGGVPLVERRLRRGDRVRPVRDRAGAHRGPAAAPPAGRRGRARGGSPGMRRIVPAIAVNAVLAVMAAFTLLPLAWMVSASFMPTGEASAIPPRLLPSAPTLAHYRALFTRLDLARNLANSAFIATAVTAIALLFNSMAGYAFAQLRFAGRDRLFRVLLAALVVPAQVGMLPLFLMLRGLHVIDTYWAVIIPGLASVFGIFLVRQYALAIPDSVLDAARVDGAGELRIYRTLVLWLCAPILVTLGVFTFMGTWNDFMWPLIVLVDQHRYTLPVALANLAGEHVQDTELMMAGAVLTVLPVMAIFVALQRWYVAGLMAGGVKE